MIRLLRSFASEPRPPAGPRSAGDWQLLAALVAAVLLEVALREDIGLVDASALFGLALTPLVLWRRSHPLLTTALAFSATGVASAAGLATGRDAPDLNALAFLLILPYALFRWGSGREVLLGLPIIAASAALGLAEDGLSPGELIGGVSVLVAPMGFGTAVRYREASRLQELEDVRSGERLRLARELHDTVAHHVSAIAVQAQAGLATWARDPRAAVDSLQVIESEASRTLAEMREMVRVLRDDGAAELAPAPRVEDLRRLEAAKHEGPRIEVALSPRTGELGDALSATVYRLAQESITNARRHARRATHIRVEVGVDEREVTLRVADDGEPSVVATSAPGYGLVGMAERAQLLGGTLSAGPDPERGWAVRAVLPRGGADATP